MFEFFSILLGMYVGVELLDLTVSLCLAFSFVFVLDGTGVWTQGFMLAKEALYSLRYPTTVFSFLRNCQPVLHCGGTILHTKQSTQVSLSPHLCQTYFPFIYF
jgi:hypothetical protein